MPAPFTLRLFFALSCPIAAEIEQTATKTQIMTNARANIFFMNHPFPRLNYEPDPTSDVLWSRHGDPVTSQPSEENNQGSQVRQFSTCDSVPSYLKAALHPHFCMPADERLFVHSRQPLPTN